MADIVSSEKRSQNMSAIRSKNTKPEVYLRKLLFAQGYRYRIADKSVPGHPDIFLRKYNTAIFVNGCFWHRHLSKLIVKTFKTGMIPASNAPPCINVNNAVVITTAITTL